MEKITFSYDFFKQIAGGLVSADVTDIHIAPASPPRIRRARVLSELRIPAKDDEGKAILIPVEKMMPKETEQFVLDLLKEARKGDEKMYEKYIETIHDRELDTTLSLPGISRFRIHISRQRQSYTCSIRVVPNKLVSFDGFPSEIKKFTKYKNGLVIVSGKTSSGKSTTLATIIEEINNTQDKKIITIEDPIEYLHRHNHSLIIQREIGLDTKDYKTGLKSALREDPDIIVLGELRDMESFEIALNAAEAGCLVFTTMHSADSQETIERLISIFPDDKQNQIRSQLSTVLRGIVCQQLIPCAKEDYGSKMVCAFEILTNNEAIANAIRKNNLANIPSLMQTNKRSDIRLMSDSLNALKNNGLISDDEWFARFSQLRKTNPTAEM